MILIVGQTEIDMPTDVVFSWVKYLGASCMKLNGNDLLDNQYAICINNDRASKEATWQFKGIDVQKVRAVWMRRWISLDFFDELNSKMDAAVLMDLLQEQDATGGHEKNAFTLPEMASMMKSEFVSQRRKEFRSYSKYFFELLNDIPTLGNPFLSEKDPSKARQIKIAQEVGLTTPDTIITNSKKDLQEFASRYNQIICKNIGEISSVYYYRLFMTYTSVIDNAFIEQLPDQFFLSLFQEAIDKEFEIRVFYLDGQLFSMAIFSGKDPQTKIDFRMYNAEKPNRTVPLKLPEELEHKIIAFMKRVNLSTGSLDLIYSKTGTYYFLEVNPVGQFCMVSFPCNYNLEKLVAAHLIKISQHGAQERN